MEILELVKSLDGVSYLADFGADRHLLNVPVDRLEVRSPFVNIRHREPEHVSLLADSMRSTGQTSLYTPLVLIQLQGDDVSIVLVDGHQRKRAAEQNGQSHIAVTWVSRWQSDEDALRDGMSANWARYELDEASIISILQQNVLPHAEVARITGRDPSVISRMAKIASREFMARLVCDGCLTYTQGASLLDACGDNGTILSALETSLGRIRTDAEGKATEWRNKIRAKARNWGRKTERQHVSYHFRKVNWKAIRKAVENQRLLTGTPTPELDITGADRLVDPVDIGDDAAWRERFAIDGFFGKRIDDVELDDLDEVIGFLPDLEMKLRWIRNHRARLDDRNRNPPPASTTLVDIDSPTPPASQQVDHMTVQ